MRDSVARNLRRRSSPRLALALLGLLVPVLIGPAAQAAPKPASMVVEADTGKVLHAEHADALRYPASLTKMMTLYLLFDALERGQISMSTRMRVSRAAAAQEPSNLALKAGQRITVRDAIQGLIIKSANDVAVVVAEHLARTESAFAAVMTRKARQLGMRRTTFTNASGLPDARQVTTARDMIKLSMALMRDFPRQYRFFSDQSFQYGGKTYKSHNKLLAQYTGTDGIKTGYIRKSGFNVAVSAVRDGKRLIGVVFGGRSGSARDRRMARLMDKGFTRSPGVREARAIPQPAAPVAGSARPPMDTETWGQFRSYAAPRGVPLQQGAGGPAAAAATQPSRVVGQAWGIQVGAYSRYAPAHLAVTQAARRAPSLLMRTRVDIHPVVKHSGTLYRARLVGLSRDNAERACRVLRRSAFPCMTVKAHGAQVSSLTQ